MKFVQTRLRLLAAVLVLLAAVPSFAAPKRRAVNAPSAGVPFTATIKGTVVDANTGLPVAFASINIGNARASATREGFFEILNVVGFGASATVTASRSGYNSQSLTFNGSGTHTLNFRLQGRPTVSVRQSNGTVVQLDDDSVKFGYVLLFGGIVASEEEDFCASDGTIVKAGSLQIKRIIGPATAVTSSSCCSRQGAQLQRVRVELRNGQSSDMTFKDSCDGYTIDLIGRDHVTGANVHTKFSDIAEVIFP